MLQQRGQRATMISALECTRPLVVIVVESAVSGMRKASVPGFPHGIFFRHTDSGIQILAIAHHGKRPGYWLSRL